MRLRRLLLAAIAAAVVAATVRTAEAWTVPSPREDGGRSVQHLQGRLHQILRLIDGAAAPAPPLAQAPAAAAPSPSVAAPTVSVAAAAAAAPEMRFAEAGVGGGPKWASKPPWWRVPPQEVPESALEAWPRAPPSSDPHNPGSPLNPGPANADPEDPQQVWSIWSPKRMDDTPHPALMEA